MDPQLKTLLYIGAAIATGAAGTLLPGVTPEVVELKKLFLLASGYCMGVVLQRRPADDDLVEKARKFDALEKLRRNGQG